MSKNHVTLQELKEGATLESAESSEDEDECTWTPTRLAITAADIQVLYFSGELKMWDRPCFYPSLADAEFGNMLLQDCNVDGYRGWVECAGSAESRWVCIGTLPPAQFSA